MGFHYPNKSFSWILKEIILSAVPEKGAKDEARKVLADYMSKGTIDKLRLHRRFQSEGERNKRVVRGIKYRTELGKSPTTHSARSFSRG